MQIDNLTSRYPGMGAFEEMQRPLFFGRSKEKEALLQALKVERSIVLFAKSGVGKSSLLNAGLIPYMPGNGFYPIRVRLGYADNVDYKSPLEITKDRVQKLEGREDVAVAVRSGLLFDAEAPRLWELFKQLVFPDYISKEDNARKELVREFRSKEVYLPNLADAGNTPHSLIPVLIFDQFEEFFSYKSEDRHEFMTQLSELLHEMSPNRILEWLRSKEMDDRSDAMIEWAKQPVIKCIFAIRDDKLAELDALKKYIPLILRNRFRLLPLDKVNAREAMENPATLSGKYISPVFDFESDWLEKVLEKLNGETDMEEEGRKAVDGAAGGIDGTQLQKICMYVEKKVVGLAPKMEEDVCINKDIIPLEEVDNILNRFYDDQLKTIGSLKDIEFCRDIIEGHLVAGGGRAIVTESLMKELLGDREGLLVKMLDARLIREEYTHLGPMYELSHDSMVKPVLKYARDKKRARLEEERVRLDAEKQKQARYKIVFMGLAAVALVFMGIAFWMSLSASDQLNQNKGWLAQKFYDENNHYRAFRLWDDFQSIAWFAGREKDSARQLLDSLFFFDISGGNRLEYVPPGNFVALGADNRVDVWTTPQTGLRLSVTSVHNVSHFEDISKSGNYMLLRGKDGTLMFYSFRERKTQNVKDASRTGKSGSGKMLENLGESLAGFIKGSDKFWYLAEDGGVFIYDPHTSQQLNYAFARIDLSDWNDENSLYLDIKMKISPDGKLLAVNIDEDLKIFELRPDLQPALVDTVMGVLSADLDKDGTWIVYRTFGTLFASSSLNGWRHAESKKFPVIREYPIPSPGRILFVGPKGWLTVYNAETDSVELVTNDVARRSAIAAKIYNANLLPREIVPWDNGMLMYEDKEGKQVFYSYERGRFGEFGFDTFLVFSPDRKYYAVLEERGWLGIYGYEDKEMLDRRYLGKDSIIPFMEGLIFRFSQSGRNMAMLRKDSTGGSILEVYHLPDKRKTFSMHLPKDMMMMDFPSDNAIIVKDQYENSGVILLDDQPRNRQYFSERYPELNKTELIRLGVK